MSDDQEIRINDLPCAAWLRYNSMSASHLENEGNTGFWVYPATDVLLELIEEFASGEATVEPKEFNKCLIHSRHQIQRFIHVNTPVRKAPGDTRDSEI